MSFRFSDDAWTGPEKLVIGIDIGTTCSAVSYAHLIRGEIRSFDLSVSC